VQEQRHTLGNVERAAIAEMLQLQKRHQNINAAVGAAVPLMIGGAVVSAVVIGTNAYRAIQNGALQEGAYKGLQSFLFGTEAANAAQANRKARGVTATDDIISLILNRRPARRGGDGFFSPR